MRFLIRLVVAALCVGLTTTSSGCGTPDVDLATAIKVSDVTTGWFDAGIVDRKNKLVPSVSFTVINGSQVKLGSLQVFSVFRFLNETEELGSTLIVLHGSDALAPGARSKPITVRANWGFTGEQPRGQMLMHSSFKDARVEIFVKYGPGPYVKITELTIQRQLLTS
jgi:hypothetical protein